MRVKKLILIILLTFFSLLLCSILVNIDFFGFASGKHTLNLALVFASLAVSYILTIIIFLLDFSDRRDLIKVYLLSSFFFGLTFFWLNKNLIVAVFVTLLFLLLLFYTYFSTTKRSRLFVKFQAKQIIFPVVKRAFLFLTAIFAVLSFFQTRSLISKNNLITEALLRNLSRPVVLLLNKHFAAQLQARLGRRFERAIGSQNREEIVRFVLAEIVELMSEGTARQALGFNPKTIPIEKTIVYENGEIDLTPVINNMLPGIADNLNRRFKAYLVLIPFIVTGLLIITLVPLTVWPFELLAGFLTPLIFFIIIKSGLIKIKKETIEAERVSFL